MSRCRRPALSLTGCTEPRAGARPPSRHVSAGGRHPLRRALGSVGGVRAASTRAVLWEGLPTKRTGPARSRARPCGEKM